VAGLLIFLPVLWTYYCEPRSLAGVASGALCIVGAAWAVAVLPFVGRLWVRVTRSTVLVRRGLLPRWSEWPLSDVTRCRTIRYDSDRLVGPYDQVRGVGRSLVRYSAWGDQGVLIELKDRSYLLLGSEQPAGLTRALESVGVETAAPAEPAAGVPAALRPMPPPEDEEWPPLPPTGSLPAEEGVDPRESFLAIARAPLLYRDVEQRDWVKAAVILFAMVFAPAMVLMYGEDVWEQVRAHWSYWIAIGLGIPLYLAIPLYIFAGRCWTCVTALGCATWMGSYCRAWGPEEMVSCRPIDAIDALRGDTVAGAVWAAPEVLLGPFAHLPAFGQPYRRLWVGGVMLTLRSGDRVILPSNDPDALCDALARIGVSRRPQLSASDA
jgi:hypothetical protein